jgi:hypothetical protein
MAAMHQVLEGLAEIRRKMGFGLNGFGQIAQFLETDGWFSAQEKEPAHEHQFELGSAIFADPGKAFSETGAKMPPEPVGAGMKADRPKNMKIRQGKRMVLEAIQDMGFPASGFAIKKNGCATPFLSYRIQCPAAEIENIGMDFSDIGSAGPPGIGDNPVVKGVDHPLFPSRRTTTT